MAGFTTELFRRRIPQILGAYLIASWAVLEFADWAVNRYLLSPYLVDFAFALLALMAPSVLLLAWFHGAPGRDSCLVRRVSGARPGRRDDDGRRRR
jgi:hypothetical protein